MVNSANAQETQPPNNARNMTFGPQATQTADNDNNTGFVVEEEQEITQNNMTIGNNTNNNNVTSIINSTAMEGLRDMRVLLDLLEPDIIQYNLTDTFNEVVLAFSYIQGNLTAIQNQSDASGQQAQERIIQLQRDLGIARAALTTIQQQLADTSTELNTARADERSALTQLETSQAEAESLQAQLDDAQAEISQLTNELNTARAVESEPESTVVEEDTAEEVVEQEPVEESPESGTINNLDILRSLVNGNSEQQNTEPRTDPEGDGGEGDDDGV